MTEATGEVIIPGAAILRRYAAYARQYRADAAAAPWWAIKRRWALYGAAAAIVVETEALKCLIDETLAKEAVDD